MSDKVRRQSHVPYDIFVLGTAIALVYVPPRQQCDNICGIVACIYVQYNVIGEGRAVGKTHFLVLVAIVMTASHDIAEYGRCRWTAARALAEHELAVITLAAYDHAVVLIVHPIYI